MSTQERLAYRITGYAVGTDLLVESFDLSTLSLKLVRRLVQVGADDPDTLASYRIKPSDLAYLATVLGGPPLSGHCEYFLEAFVRPEQLMAIRRRMATSSDIRRE